jgi:hypothetical protein
MSDPVKTTLTFSKSTKNTHVYASDAPDAPIPSVYIKRAALPAQAPASITLTITVN